MFRPRPLRLILFLLSFALLLAAAELRTHAQTEAWVPETIGFYGSEIKVWTSSTNGQTFAKVRLTFINTGYRVSDWGQVTRVGNQFIVDAKVERWTGASGQAITIKENTYNLGTLSPGTYVFTFRSYGVPIRSQQFDPANVIERWEMVTLPSGQTSIAIWTFPAGATTATVALYFPDTGYRVADWGQLLRSGNNFSVDLKVERWTGETEARAQIALHDYNLGLLAAGSYSFTVRMQGVSVKTQAFNIEGSSAPAPKLLTEEDSERAIALDSVTWTRLFPFIADHNFSSDRRTRIMLFAINIGAADQNTAAVTAQAEDAAHILHSLSVEYVGKVPGLDWLTQIVVKLPESLQSGGDAWMQINVRGVASNKALVNIKPAQ